MSSRGCVAVGVPLKWEGVYNHCDSYPGGLGSDLWRILSHERNVEKFCKMLLEHESWAGFLAAALGNEYEHWQDKLHITSEAPDPLFTEWVYVVDAERRMIHILVNKEVGEEDWSKPRIDPPQMRQGRIVDYGRFCYKHMLAASVSLDDPEPDWAKISREKYRDDEED